MKNVVHIQDSQGQKLKLPEDILIALRSSNLPLLPPTLVNFIVVGGNKERVDDWNAFKVLRKQILIKNF